tara:strand:+ start:128 stop:1075 length:948 start_codon:yes stop_codon:yes gene_type:complete
MNRIPNHIRGLVGEYLAQQYLISKKYKLRHIGKGYSSSDIEKEYKYKPDTNNPNNMDIRRIEEFYWDFHTPFLENVKNPRIGFSDGYGVDYCKQKGRTYTFPIIQKYFKKEFKTRKDDIFYFFETDVSKWLDFVNKNPDDIPKTKDNFYRLYLLITNYIHLMEWKVGRKNKFRKALTHKDIGTGTDIDIIGYKEDFVSDSFLSKLTNKKTINNYYAIEVKLNSSYLSNFQKIRLGLLQKYGFNAMMLNVKIDNNQLENALFNGIYEYNEIIEITDFRLSDVEFFIKEEFNQDIIYLHKKFTTFNKLYYHNVKMPY